MPTVTILPILTMIKLNVFPQIIRIFSASLLWGSLTGVVFVNILNVPQSSTNVLGAQTEKQRVEQDYAFWQSVIQEKPDYRDAYLVLGSLAYQLSRIEEGKTYADKALELDPNNTTSLKLRQLFGD